LLSYSCQGGITLALFWPILSYFSKLDFYICQCWLILDKVYLFLPRWQVYTSVWLLRTTNNHLVLSLHLSVKSSAPCTGLSAPSTTTTSSPHGPVVGSPSAKSSHWSVDTWHPTREHREERLSIKFIMCGIFAYLNHLTPKTRKEILDLLIKGLQRLEYRGYDSAGVGIDGYNGNASIEVGWERKFGCERLNS